MSGHVCIRLNHQMPKFTVAFYARKAFWESKSITRWTKNYWFSWPQSADKTKWISNISKRSLRIEHKHNRKKNCSERKHEINCEASSLHNKMLCLPIAYKLSTDEIRFLEEKKYIIFRCFSVPMPDSMRVYSLSLHVSKVVTSEAMRKTTSEENKKKRAEDTMNATRE